MYLQQRSFIRSLLFIPIHSVHSMHSNKIYIICAYLLVSIARVFSHLGFYSTLFSSFSRRFGNVFFFYVNANGYPSFQRTIKETGAQDTVRVYDMKCGVHDFRTRMNDYHE